MTASTARPRRYDSWDLATLRAGKEYRDSLGETIEELDAMLAEAERQHATGRMTTAVETPDSPSAVRRSGPGARTWTADPATPAQLRFLASLHRDLGTETPTPADKRDASRLIDLAKGALAKARKGGAAVPAAPVARPATERQVDYLRSLAAERETGMSEESLAAWRPEELSAADASTLIDAWTTLPRRAAATAAHGISEGRYAYQPEGAQAIFLRVSRTGRIYTQAGPSEHPYRGQDTDALRWIKANERDAAALYGRLLGVCGRCGRELTDETSRALGLGPICASK